MVIEDVRPRTPTPGHFAKAVVGEAVRVTAGVFKEGHDVLSGRVLLIPKGRARPESIGRLDALGNDEWEATIVPTRIGPYRIVVEAWTDRHATWSRKVLAKLDAGQPIGVEIVEGRQLLQSGSGDPVLAAALARLGDSTLDPAARVMTALTADVGRALSGPEGAPDLTASAPHPLWVDRELALFGSLVRAVPPVVRGLQGRRGRVPDVAAMGFDVLYLPPIHPIGRTASARAPTTPSRPAPDDPGSPWAIGGDDGGHTAIHPDLGTIDDFAALVAEVRAHGMEVALDYALQCSPDHPWVTEHPEWFHHRPDGSIAYAENPPKIYQDIYPINFWPADGRRPGGPVGRRAGRSSSTGSPTG